MNAQEKSDLLTKLYNHPHIRYETSVLEIIEIVIDEVEKHILSRNAIKMNKYQLEVLEKVKHIIATQSKEESEAIWKKIDEENNFGADAEEFFNQIAKTYK